MATNPGVDITQTSATAIPQAQNGQENNPSDPMQGTSSEPQNNANLTEEEQGRLIALVRRYKDQWSQDRMTLMQRCLLNLEFFKGNQFISFGPGQAQFFDAAGWMNSVGANQNEPNSDDKDLYQYCNNFYQMLATGFVAALAPQVPKSRWLPENAEHLTDVTTAKAAQTLIDIVERQNKEQSLLKQQLLYLYTTGAVFRHTRYVVDADRAGTSHEPILKETQTQITPERMHCFRCGDDNDPNVMGSKECQSCGSRLGDESFFPAEFGLTVRKVGEEELPNGMVAQNVYCPLEVDVDPAADNLRQTPILNLEVEVHLGALRAAYPGMYSQIAASSTSTLSSNGSIDRIARQQVYSQSNTYSSILQDQRPTLSRTWIQPWAFDLEDDQEFGDKMRRAYPSGLLLVNVGDTFLSAREAKLVDEWTAAGTHEGFGLYPPSIGDIVVPFQKRYNDMANILHEFMDRCSSGVTLANADLIDSKAMQGKPMLPGVLNLVKLKRTGAAGSMRMQDALFQFQFAMHEEAFNYLDKLAFNAQMFAGVPPQVYGGSGDPHVETFGGQQQQLTSAMGKLNIYWDNLREEHAAADELAVRCAKDNLTGDIKEVLAERGSEFRNHYVRLDDLAGNVHAYPDTDQGFPITAAELRQRWMDLMEAAARNPVAQAIFDDPSNQEQAATALGVPGMTVPGAAMRSKVLQNIDKLIQSQPIPTTDPQSGQPTGQMQPSIMPDKDIDDFTVLKQVVRQYCQENCDIADDNPAGFANVLAYLTAAVAMETQQQSEQSAQKLAIAQAGMPMPPQPAAPDPVEQDLRLALIKDAGQAVQNQLLIGGQPALPQGASLQAQVAEQAVWCCVDEENKEIRIGLPVGTSTVPNVCLTLNYQEGLEGPIHFSQYVGKEIAMGAARKWSVDDIAGFCGVRMERTLPLNASPFGSQRQSQVLIASSSPDGTVQAISPGVYNDNGQGIDCQYETVCDPGNMAVSMLGGLSINALGVGRMNVSVMVARSYVTSSGQPNAAPYDTREIKLAPFLLTPENWKGYSGGARGQNERFRGRFTNGKVPDAWFALKYVNLFTRSLFSGRTAGGN